MSESPARAIGARIKRLRQRLGMTADELGARIGVAAAQVYRIEAGLTSASFNKLFILASALGVEARDLIPAPQDEDGGDHLQLSLRGTGLTKEEVERVLEFAKHLRESRPDQRQDDNGRV